MLNNSPQTALMQALGFNADDLRCNRDGCITPRQRARLTHERNFWAGGALMAVGVSPVASVYAVAEFGKMLHNDWLVIGLVVLLAVAVAAYFVFRWRRLNADLCSDGIQVVEGIVKCEASAYRSRDDFYYTLSIQDHSFIVSKTTFDAFHDGSHYRLYYTPNTQALLSAEIV